MGWLLLFTAQMVLLHRGQVSTHRRLGIYGAVLAAGMVLLGVLTAIMTEQIKFGTPASDPPFLSVRLADMLVFGGLVTASIRARRIPAAHKRLILIATLVLIDAGFGRWLSPKIVEWAGLKNYWDRRVLVMRFGIQVEQRQASHDQHTDGQPSDGPPSRPSNRNSVNLS